MIHRGPSRIGKARRIQSVVADFLPPEMIDPWDLMAPEIGN
jgi:hypothetical protein